MSLQHIPVDSILEQDLQRLVGDQVPESKHLDYKRDFCLVTDEQKREFLSDVTALANTDGGDLIYGMREVDGVAGEVVGLKNFNADSAFSTIENVLRDFVQPRLKGHRLWVVDLQNGKHALILRIPRSFTAPHMVFHKGVSRFCGRNSNGKYDLDVQELRAAFTDNEAIGERLKTFRLDRVNKLISGEGVVSLRSNHLVVLHILPVSGAYSANRISSDKMAKLDQHEHIQPMDSKRSKSWGKQTNFDGLSAVSYKDNREGWSYVQVYWNGFIESVSCGMLEPITNALGREVPVKHIIHSVPLENQIIESYNRSIKVLGVVGCGIPVVVSLSFLNVRGYQMAVDSYYVSDGASPIDRDHLLTMEIVVDSENCQGEVVLKPLFDQLWNACGYPESRNYNPDGTRKSNP